MLRLSLSELDDDERRIIGPFLTSGPSHSHEYRGFCLQCETPGKSKTPSASFNFVRGQWNCLKGDHGGTISKLIKEHDEPAAEVIDISTGKKRPKDPLPDDRAIKGMQKALRANARALEYLIEERGLDEETIERWEVGWHANRRKYTLPIRDGSGRLVNLRMYNPKAKGATPKMLPYASGYGTQVYGLDVLESNDDIVLCEGEWDMQLNNQHGIPTVTTTGGVNGFQMAWVKQFKGKRVWICHDEDDVGRSGAVKTARMLDGVAEAVYIIPTLETNRKGGDITDFYVHCNGTAERFQAFMDSAAEHPFSLKDEQHEVAQTGKAVSLVESQNATYKEPIEVHVMVAGVGNHYAVPKTLTARCNQDKGKACAVCPLMAHDGERTKTTHPDDSTLLRFIDATEIRARALLREQMNAKCNDVDYTINDEWNVQELVVTQSLEDRGEEVQTPLHRTAYNIGYQAEANTLVRLVGRQVAHWQNQKAVLHTWHMERKQSDIDDFNLTEEQHEQLLKFQRATGQTPLEKCKEIATDLSDNVTRIYGREQLHVAYDLVWHSVLGFKVQGRRVSKGWLEGIVIGDTRTGKSEAASRLLDHYAAGAMVSCETVTYAGLVGGAMSTPSGKGWMVQWGIIPLNDKRLVVLDEMSGMLKAGNGNDKGMIDMMSSIRSSGFAEVTKIVKDRTSARTRLMWISNPVGGKPFSELAGGGVQAIRKMIRNPEDIARFDFALAASGKDVEPDVINSMHHDSVEHVYDAESCALLVRWAWSRREEHVQWLRGSEQYLIDAAMDLGSRYLNDPPLVQAENIREKLARIAVAIAARTFSTRDGVRVRVGRAHIASAVEFLDWVYGSDSMAYAKQSRAMMRRRARAAARKGTIKKYVKKNSGVLVALRAVMHSNTFRVKDLEESGGLETDARELARLLTEAEMIRRITDAPNLYTLEPTMVEILNEIEDEEDS